MLALTLNDHKQIKVHQKGGNFTQLRSGPEYRTLIRFVFLKQETYYASVKPVM